MLARETEQLARIAERLRRGRRVLSVVVCEPVHRGEVLAWLSKAAGKEVPSPLERSAAELLDLLDAAARAPVGEVASLAWIPGDRDALAALNLHREKLRRGASVLIWCSPQDLATLQTEGQDVYSFRDTLVLVSGFSVPAVHVPSIDTTEIRLARARLDLPGTPAEKALAAAELGMQLLNRGYHVEAVQVCAPAIEPFLMDDFEEAGRGTLAYLAATLSVALAAAGDVSAAHRWSAAALENLIQTGAVGEDHAVYLDAVEPASVAAVAAARVLQGNAAELPWDELHRYYGLHLAEEVARTGTVRMWRPFEGARPEEEELGIVLEARGEMEEARRLFGEGARRAQDRDEDNRSSLLRVVNSLLCGGEVLGAAALLNQLRETRPVDLLQQRARAPRAWWLALMGRVKDACRLLRFEQPLPDLDGITYQSSAALAGIIRAGAGARRVREADIMDAASYLTAVEGWLPQREEGEPPFYQILLPGLRADLLSLIPERRSEAADLARAAWQLAREEYPRYAPEQAAKVIRCLLFLEQPDKALEVLSIAEGESESLEDLRSLSELQAQHVVALVRSGAGMDTAMAALRETLDATGSPRITAGRLLLLARDLPLEWAQPDVLALLDEAAELFAEMAMLPMEELCRETRGDVLLARGRREEAAACFAAAEKRLRHYGLLLRVPLLRVKRGAARPAVSDSQ